MDPYIQPETRGGLGPPLWTGHAPPKTAQRVGLSCSRPVPGQIQEPPSQSQIIIGRASSEYNRPSLCNLHFNLSMIVSPPPLLVAPRSDWIQVATRRSSWPVVHFIFSIFHFFLPGVRTQTVTFGRILREVFSIERTAQGSSATRAVPLRFGTASSRLWQNQGNWSFDFRGRKKCA